MRFSKSWKGESFLKSDKTSDFLRKKAALFCHFKLHHSHDTIYTLVTMFATVAGSDFSDVLVKLNEKKSFYTSFSAYFDSFQMETHPFLHEQAMNELQKAKQGDKESLVTYYNRFERLVRATGQDPDSYATQFTQGMRSARMRDFAMMSCHGQRMTFRGAFQEASSVECYDKIVNPEKANKKANEAKVSTVSEQKDGANKGGNGNNKGANKAGNQPQQQKQQQQQQQQGKQGSSQSRGGGGNARGKGGNRGGNRGGKGGNRGGKAGNVSAANLTCPSPNAGPDEWKDWYLREGDHGEWLDHIKSNCPQSLLNGRCAGCLGSGHSFDLSFQRCSNSCVFCGTPFYSPAGHPASLCSHRPQNEDDALALIC